MLFISAVDAFFAVNNLSYLTTVIDVLCAVLLAWAIIRLGRRLLHKLTEHRCKDLPEAQQRQLRTAAGISGSLLKYLVLFIAGAIILGELGLEKAMTSMLAAAGIGGIALGIGAQNLIGDVASGIFMLLSNELQVGDFVRIGETEGVVEAYSLRVTSLRGLRGELILIHNGQIKGVVNYSRGDYLALVDVQIAYEADVPRARAAMTEEALRYAEAQGWKTQPRDMGMVALGASGVTLRVGLSLGDPLARWRTESALREQIKARFGAEGIEIPYEKLVILPQEQKDGAR